MHKKSVVGTNVVWFVCLLRPEVRSTTNVHYLVFHLTLADSIICYIVLPMETLWRLTIQWEAGNFLCKFLMMFRTGGFILSSCILVVISIDRSGDTEFGHIDHHSSLSLLLKVFVYQQTSSLSQHSQAEAESQVSIYKQTC